MRIILNRFESFSGNPKFVLLAKFFLYEIDLQGSWGLLQMCVKSAETLITPMGELPRAASFDQVLSCVLSLCPHTLCRYGERSRARANFWTPTAPESRFAVMKVRRNLISSKGAANHSRLGHGGPVQCCWRAVRQRNLRFSGFRVYQFKILKA